MTDILHYPAWVVQAGTRLQAVFPDLPGCKVWFTDMADAFKAAQTGLDKYLQDLEDQQKKWPAPTDVEKLTPPADRELFGVLIVPARKRSALKRINIMLEEDLIARVDEYASNTNLSRSQAIGKILERLL